MATVEPELVERVKALLREGRERATPERIQEARLALADAEARSANESTEEIRFALLQLLALSKNLKERAEAIEGLKQLAAAGTLGSKVQLWLIFALFEHGELSACRAATASLALSEPTNRMAEGMIGVLRERYESEGPTAMLQLGLLAGGVAIAVGVGVWWLMRRRGAASAPAALAPSALAFGLPRSRLR